MAFFKSKFSKFHLGIALFAALNILLGLGLATNVNFYKTAAILHYTSGILIFVVPVLLLMVFKERKMIWKAFVFRLAIQEKDLGDWKSFSAKIFAWLFLISLFYAGMLAILVKTGIGTLLFPETNLFLLHIKVIYLVIPILVLHVITMMVTNRKNK